MRGPADRFGAERVAFGQAELAPDDLVLGAGVADDVDAFDVDARPLADIEGQVDDVLDRIAGDARLDVHERIAAVVHGFLDQVGGAADRVAVVPVACGELQAGPQVVAAQVAKLGVDGDLADLVALALVDRERQEEALAVGRQFGTGIGDLDVGIAVLQIEPAQQFLVVGQTFRVVLVGRGQKAPPAGFAAVDDLGQPVLAERLVAVDHDLG